MRYLIEFLLGLLLRVRESARSVASRGSWLRRQATSASISGVMLRLGLQPNQYADVKAHGLPLAETAPPEVGLAGDELQADGRGTHKEDVRERGKWRRRRHLRIKRDRRLGQLA